MLGTLQFAVGGLSGALVGLLHNGTALPMTAVFAVCATGALLVLRTLAQPREAMTPVALPVTEE